jgi:hypothetical protein
MNAHVCVVARTRAPRYDTPQTHYGNNGHDGIKEDGLIHERRQIQGAFLDGVLYHAGGNFHSGQRSTIATVPQRRQALSSTPNNGQPTRPQGRRRRRRRRRRLAHLVCAKWFGSARGAVCRNVGFAQTTATGRCCHCKGNFPRYRLFAILFVHAAPLHPTLYSTILQTRFDKVTTLGLGILPSFFLDTPKYRSCLDNQVN